MKIFLGIVVMAVSLVCLYFSWNYKNEYFPLTVMLSPLSSPHVYNESSRRGTGRPMCARLFRIEKSDLSEFTTGSEMILELPIGEAACHSTENSTVSWQAAHKQVEKTWGDITFQIIGVLASVVLFLYGLIKFDEGRHELDIRFIDDFE